MSLFQLLLLSPEFWVIAIVIFLAIWFLILKTIEVRTKARDARASENISKAISEISNHIGVESMNNLDIDFEAALKGAESSQQNIDTAINPTEALSKALGGIVNKRSPELALSMYALGVTRAKNTADNLLVQATQKTAQQAMKEQSDLHDYTPPTGIESSQEEISQSEVNSSQMESQEPQNYQTSEHENSGYDFNGESYFAKQKLLRESFIPALFNDTQININNINLHDNWTFDSLNNELLLKIIITIHGKNSESDEYRRIDVFLQKLKKQRNL